MRSEEDIRNVAEHLQRVAQEMASHSLSLDEMIERTAEAVRVYRSFRKTFAETQMVVQVLRRRDDGAFSEDEFDWKAL